MMRTHMLCLSLILILMGCKNPSPNSESKNNSDISLEDDSNPPLSTAEAIAIKSGYENWKDVHEITFTFNVDRKENHFERSWIWKPQTQEVTMIMKEDTVSYNRNKIDSTNLKTDAYFINDKYWLLAPFNLVWDEGTHFSEKQNVIAPISKDTLNMITILYDNEVGYTPGDAYDFYFGNDFIIKEWVFREKNSDTASMTTTWEDYEDFKGIKIAKKHQDATRPWSLYFTGIKVK